MSKTVKESKDTLDTVEKTTQTAAGGKSGEELVAIRLFKDNERYKDDVFVAVNGRSFQIKRGETVMVPRYVADVLEQSMDQDAATAKLMDRESAAYSAQARELGL